MEMSQPTDTSAAETPRSVLMQELKFQPEDLQANRDGYLSDRQQQYLHIDRRKNALIGAVVVAGLVLGTAFLLFVGIRNENLILQGLGVVLILCNTAVTTLFGLNYVRTGFDIDAGNVDTVEGEAQHVVRQVGSAQAGSVRIGDVVEVPTNVEAFKAFEPGQRYRLYRTVRTHRLLSVEKVTDA